MHAASFYILPLKPVWALTLWHMDGVSSSQLWNFMTREEHRYAFKHSVDENEWVDMQMMGIFITLKVVRSRADYVYQRGAYVHDFELH